MFLNGFPHDQLHHHPERQHLNLGAGQHAFFRDSSGPDVLVVQQDAFLTTAGSGSAGVRLANTGSWAVTVEGLVFASQYIGMDLDAGNTGASTVAIGAEGGIGGSIGLLIGSAAAIQNAGTISGTSGLAISLGGTGSHSSRTEGHQRQHHHERPGQRRRCD
jgi:hypothetical protein